VQPGLAGHPVLAWEKDGAERAGLVKIDLLGNRSLAVLRDCIELCSREPDAPPEARSWEGFNPVDEASARALIESGSTIGIFYIESPATRQLLAKMRRADYAHLVAASSIIRPAANRYINEYVRRLRGQAWKRLPEPVEACLSDTYGIMVYQEDVSRVSMAAAGFSAVEADQLRKTLTKKRGSARLQAFKERFLEGCAERLVPPDAAGELWSMMLSFDGYSFCKAHSASYALVSYRLAWMKARRPAYFIASVINNGGGFYGIQSYVDEARRLGCRVLAPLVNKSGLRYALEREPARDGQAEGERASEPRLRAGLLQVKGLSAAGAQAIVAARERGGAFSSALDFISRVKSPYDEYRALARSGCLDGLALSRPDGEPATRPALLWAYHHWRGGAAAPAGELFPSVCVPPCIRDYTSGRKLADEAEFLGVILSAYPPELFSLRADSMVARLGWPARLKSDALARAVGRRISMLGLAVAGKEVVTSEGKPMCFRSFSDEAGVYECVLFPQAYKRLMPILEGNGAFLVLGVAREEHGALALHVEDAVSLNKSNRGAR
jgi:DNA polymerase III alpha subunit